MYKCNGPYIAKVKKNAKFFATRILRNNSISNCIKGSCQSLCQYARHADSTECVFERTVSGGWFRGTCRDTRLLIRVYLPQREETVARVMHLWPRDRRPHRMPNPRSRMLGNRVRLRLHRVSISARNDRSNHSLNEVRSASEPYAYSNFDRTLADAVESAATICALMYRETSPRRRHGDVTGTVRLSTNQILRYTGCRAQFFT